MKWAPDVHHPANITATTIVYIPSLDGYWAESLEVLKICLTSMRKTSETPFDLMVFDNGSCSAVQDYLLEQQKLGLIQFLLLSKHNIGKVGAWNYAMVAAPGEMIFYTDSDVLFLPGWLEASVEVLRTFPKAGMITAQPARRRHRFSELNSATLSDAARDSSISIEQGEYLPQQYLTAHRIGLGETEEKYLRRIGNQEDTRLSKGAVSAFVSATHFQFLTTKTAMNKVLPLEIKSPLGGDDRRFDESMNEAGFWRLSTSEFLVQHIGNTVPSSLNDYGLSNLESENLLFGENKLEQYSNNAGPNRPKFLQYLLKRSKVKRILRRVSVLSNKLLLES